MPDDTAALLRAQTCVGQCSRDTPHVAPAERDRLLAALPDWRLEEGGHSISRSFVARNFNAALGFLNACGAVAERETHHPDMHLTSYRNVKLVLSTHASRGLTHADFILAAKLDELPVEYSPAWVREREREASS